MNYLLLLLLFSFCPSFAMENAQAKVQSQIQKRCNRPGCIIMASVGTHCHLLRKCGVVYCSLECQSDDATRHQFYCNVLQDINPPYGTQKSLPTELEIALIFRRVPQLSGAHH